MLANPMAIEESRANFLLFIYAVICDNFERTMSKYSDLRSHKIY